MQRADASSSPLTMFAGRTFDLGSAPHRTPAVPDPSDSDSDKSEESDKTRMKSTSKLVTLPLLQPTVRSNRDATGIWSEAGGGVSTSSAEQSGARAAGGRNASAIFSAQTDT